MKIIKKSFIEKIYKGMQFNEYVINEVRDRNPLKVENDFNIQCFRFYDREYIIDDKKIFQGKALNYSNWIYFGKRMGLDEIEIKYGDDPNYKNLINNMVNNGYEYICKTQSGPFLPMMPGEVTFDEYVKENEKNMSLIKK